MARAGLKDAVRLVAPPLLWTMGRRLVQLRSDDRGEAKNLRPGLRGLDSRLEEYVNTSQPGFFVELGANDGIDQSNTYFLELPRA